MPSGGLDRSGNGREADSETNDIVVFIQKHCDMLKIDDQTEIINHQLFHTVRERNGAVQKIVGFV